MNYSLTLCIIMIVVANLLALVGCDRKYSRPQSLQDLEETGDPLTERASVETDSLLEEALADGASRAVADAEGRTPLHMAVASKKSRAVRELIEQGTSLDSKTSKGNAPLHLATIAGDTLAVEILLKSGADVNQPAAGGFTPLHFVCLPPIDSSLEEEIRLTLARLLIFYQAKVNLTSHDGRTPLHIAAQWGSPALVDLLLLNGAAPMIKDRKGQTPADAAMAVGLNDIAQRIRDEQQRGL